LKALEGGTEGPQTAPETIPAVVFGTIGGAPPDQPLTTTIRACADVGFKDEIGVFRSSGSHFVLALPAGTYFFSLLADAAGTGKPAPGDLLGFYGVTTLRRGHGPQPLLLSGGELRPLDFTLCARLDQDLHPVPLP
jgi:hypothetical protein